MTMKLVPDYIVNKSKYERVSWDSLFYGKDYERILKEVDFLSFFTKWDKREMTSVWVGKKFTST